MTNKIIRYIRGVEIVATNFLRREFPRWLDKQFTRVPILKYFYRAFRWRISSLFHKGAKLDWQIHWWMLDGLDFVKKHKLRDFIFTESGGFVRMPDGLEFWFDPDQHGGMIGPLMFSDARLDMPEVVTLQTVLKNVSNSIVIDAGAGYGDYACGVAFNSPNAIVHAFEPDAALYSSLIKSVQHNKLNERVYCYQLALADKEGPFDLKVPNQVVIVPATTIDGFLGKYKIERVDFIKADIEGAELSMLRGSVKCLEKYKPNLLLEIVTGHALRMVNSVDALLKFLHEFGYENCAYVNEKEQVFIKPIENLKKYLTQEYNFFFWHRDKSFNL